MNDRFLMPGDLIEVRSEHKYYDRTQPLYLETRWLPMGVYLIVKNTGYTRVPSWSSLSGVNDIVMTPVVLGGGSYLYECISIRKSELGKRWQYVIRADECNSDDP